MPCQWPECWSVAMTGGGIQPGRIVGASDERGAYVADREVHIGDIHATIYKAMGIDWHKEYMHPIGRPINEQTTEQVRRRRQIQPVAHLDRLGIQRLVSHQYPTALWFDRTADPELQSIVAVDRWG